VYGAFGLGGFRVVLSTRPEKKFIGKASDWDRAEAALRIALEGAGVDWTINPGDGAFYGPKIDIILKDSDGKEHQTATVQLDFQLPERFNLQYKAPAPELERQGRPTTEPSLTGTSGMVRPVIIHRAILGSLERFMALLIEHYDGKYPFWLSPRQVMICTIKDDAEMMAYAEKVRRIISGEGVADGEAQAPSRTRDVFARRFRVDLDLDAKALRKKNRDARDLGYRLFVTIGQEEMHNDTIKVDVLGVHNIEKAKDKLKDVGFDMETMRCTMNPSSLYKAMVELERNLL
jgi:threonyl-tRNA synthetase